MAGHDHEHGTTTDAALVAIAFLEAQMAHDEQRSREVAKTTCSAELAAGMTQVAAVLMQLTQFSTRLPRADVIDVVRSGVLTAGTVLDALAKLPRKGPQS